MKLLNLKVQGFGALQNLDAAFQGAPRVILGLNEAGKTAFIDALHSALFGLPKLSEKEGRDFEVRYGVGNCTAEAILRRPDGTELTSSTATPRGKELVSASVYKSLLVIRSGACALSKAAEPDFIPAFLNLTVGAGGVNLKQALVNLAKITSGRGRGFWEKLTAPVHARVAALKAHQQTADSHDEAAKRASIAEARLRDLRENEEEQRKEWALLEAANRSWELSNLRELQSRLSQCAEGLAHRDDLNEAAHKKLVELERSAKAQESARDLARSKAESLQREAQDAQARLDQCLADLEKLPPPGTRAGLKTALEELAAAQSAPRVGLPALWRGVIAGALGLAAGAFAFHLWGLPAGLMATAATSVIAWFIIGAGAQGPTSAPDAARMKFELALTAMGSDWAGLSIQAAQSRLDELSKIADKTGWEKERTQELKKQKTEALSQAEAQSLAAQASIDSLEKDLQGALKPWGATTVNMAAKILSDLESDRRQLKTLLSDLAKPLGETFSDARAADAGIRKKISQLMAALEAEPQAAPEISREEHEKRQAACKKRLETIRRELIALDTDRTNAIKESSVLEGRLEGSPAALYAELEQKQLHLEDLELWRKAAAVAEEAIGGLLADTGRGLKDCVKDAVPLFTEMTSERYTDVEMVKDNPLEAQALSVTHKTFGPKPADWISQGTQDLLWLALRMAWAKRAFPTGSLLVLDEPCLTLDPGRAAAVVAALLKNPIMAGWQIIVLTKDERIAAACESAGAARTELSPS